MLKFYLRKNSSIKLVQPIFTVIQYVEGWSSTMVRWAGLDRDEVQILSEGIPELF